MLTDIIKKATKPPLNIISGAKIAHMDGQCADEDSCTGLELVDYVDGVELDATTVVSLNGDNWELIYPKFKNITTGSKYNLVDSVTPPTATYAETLNKEKLDSNGN